MSTSEIQKQRNKSRYDLLKTLNRCVICGKQDAYTLMGKSCCCDCLEKKRQYAKNYNATHPEICRETHKNSILKRKLNKLCIYCGRPIPSHRSGKVTCQLCAEKNHKRYLQNSKTQK